MTSPWRFAASTFAALTFAWAVHAQPLSLQDLHEVLQLSPTQESAWIAFETAMAPDPQQAARHRTAASMMPALSAPRRVDLSIAAMKADLQTLEQRGAALKAFYATLSSTQQTTFDRDTAPTAQ